MARAPLATKTSPQPARPARPPPKRAEPSAAVQLQARIGAGAARGLAMPAAPKVEGPASNGAAHPRKGGGTHKAGPAPAPHPEGGGKAPTKGGQAGKAGAEKLATPEREGSGAKASGMPEAVADAAGGGKGGGGGAVAVDLHMPEPPSGPSPATAKRIAGVKARAGGTASAQAALPPGAKQVGDAEKAVTPPDAERAAQARAQLIAEVGAAPSPEIVKLCEHIREVIRNKRPPDEDALMEAKPDAAAADAGNQLNSTVDSEAKKVQSNYDGMNGSPAGAPAPNAPPVPPQPGAAPTPGINAGAAVPDAVPAQNVSLDKDAEDSKKKTEAAGMNTAPAQLVQSGPIAEARAAQGELDQTAREDPAVVMAQQKEALGKAEGDMAALQMQALSALTASRAGTSAKATTGQHAMVGSEEQMRLKAGTDAKAAFDDAQTAVKGLLKDLAGNAMAEWEAAKTVLTAQFKADLAVVQKRVDERHEGASGFVVGLWDAVTGLPDWAEEAYSRAETNFSEGVIAKLTTISANVNSIIAACDLIIKTARIRIQQTFAELPASLKSWADGEQAKFDGQLDQLHNQAIAERDAFNKDLVERSTAAVDEVRTEIAELRKKVGGLVGRIVSAVNRFLDDPVKFIIEGLLELLGIPPAAFWAVVAKIKKVVKDIAADPMGFANNLMKGLGEGFGRFFDNFGTHLLKGFLGWLLGDLKDVQVPKDVSLKSIVTFFLQLAGITWPNIRKILVKKIGAKNVALIEKVYSLVSTLIELGPQGIYEMIKEKLDPQAIVDQVVSMAVDYMVTAIAKQVAVRLLMLFNPAGAIAQALEAIYRVLKWVFQNAARIFALVEAVVNGIADIIAGNTGGFAAAVEKGLGMLIAPVIGFIADYFSLGDLPSIVAKKIQSMRDWIMGMIEKAFDWLIEKGKALLAAIGLGGKKKEDDKKRGSGDEEIGESVDFQAGDESHRLWIEVNGQQATVMVASDKKSVHAFLNSAQIKEAGKTQPKILSLKDQAETMAKTVNMEAIDLTKELAASADAAKSNTAGKQKKTVSDERALADKIREIMELMVGMPEPVAGIHGHLKSVSTAGRESHHVPAKAMGSALAEFLTMTASGLKGPGWRENDLAAGISKRLSDRGKQLQGLAVYPADSLSAISVSHKCHREDAGIHSSDNADVLAALASDPENDILLCKKKTADRLHETANVSVNPRVAGWHGFLVDARMKIKNANFTTNLKTDRDERAAATMILDEAAQELGEIEDATKNMLASRVIGPINSLLQEAPQLAYNSGRAIVETAMNGVKEGSDKGRAAALGDLDKAFKIGWAPFRTKI